MLCVPKPPAKPPEDYDKCILLFVSMQAIIPASSPSCVLTKLKSLFEMPGLLVRGNCGAMSDSPSFPLHSHLGSFSVLKWYLQITFISLAAPWGQCNCEHLQPWISSTEVLYFTDFASGSRHMSQLHFHAYHSGNLFHMHWDPVVQIMSNLEPGSHWQDDVQCKMFLDPSMELFSGDELRLACASVQRSDFVENLLVVPSMVWGTSCLQLQIICSYFLCPILSGLPRQISEFDGRSRVAEHSEVVHLALYLHRCSHMEIVENLAMTMEQQHISINFALMGSETIQGEQVNHKNVQYHTCCLVQPLEGAKFFILCDAPYEFYSEKFALLIDRVHKWRMQYKAVESDGSNCSFGISLAGGVKFKSGVVQSHEQCTEKLVLSALPSHEQWDPGGLNFADVRGLQVPCSSPRLVDCAVQMLGLVFTRDNSYEPTKSWHRLGGKPVVKGEGMSASLLSWAVNYGLGPAASLPQELKPHRLQLSG